MTGYRIGAQCFSSYEAATDYQLSQVVPTITADGKLQHPVKQGEVWTYAGQEIKPSFGSCDIAQEFSQGAQIGGAIVLLMVVAWGIRYLNDFIRSMLMPNDRSDE